MSWFGFGRKGDASASTTSAAPAAGEELSAQEIKRQLFTAYVEDISASQRRDIADRLDKIAYFSDNSFRHFLYSEIGTLIVIYGYGMVYSHRNFVRTTVDRLRPLVPALFMGAIIYNLVFNLREMAMRSRLSAVIKDYEFFIKANKCHHVEAGMTQLAWLQFVEDYTNEFKNECLDTAKMRTESISAASYSSHTDSLKRLLAEKEKAAL